MNGTRTPKAGGFLLAISILAGALIGTWLGQPTIGILTGTGIGILLLILVWAMDRQKQ